MSLLDIYNDLLEHPDVRSFTSKEEVYLSHLCLIEEANKTGDWEFGFYHPDSGKVTVFETNPVKMRPSDDVLKRDSEEVQLLDLNSIKVGYDAACTISDEEALKKGAKLINKRIMILQKTDRTMWNNTILTESFNLVNVKIDAITGEVISSEAISIYDMGLKKA